MYTYIYIHQSICCNLLRSFESDSGSPACSGFRNHTGAWQIEMWESDLEKYGMNQPKNGDSNQQNHDFTKKNCDLTTTNMEIQRFKTCDRMLQDIWVHFGK